MSSREGGGGRLGGRAGWGVGEGSHSRERETASKCEHQRRSQISDRPFGCVTVAGCMGLMAEMMMMLEEDCSVCYHVSVSASAVDESRAVK